VKRGRQFVVDQAHAARLRNGAIVVTMLDTKGRRMRLYLRSRRVAREIRDAIAEPDWGQVPWWMT